MLSPLIALIGLGLDSLSIAFVYSNYNKKINEISLLKDTVVYYRTSDILEELTSRNTRSISYVGVQGVVKATGDLLSSQHCDDVKGVIRHNCLVEHCDEIRRGTWVNVINVLRNRYAVSPFSLVSDQIDIEIKEPLKADFLKRELTLTFKEFEPIYSSLYANSMARIMGSISRGFEETEYLLHEDKNMLAYGSVMLNSAGKLTLSPPSDGNLPGYIITSKSRGDILESLNQSAEELRWTYRVLGGIAGALVLYLAWKTYSAYKRRRLYKHMIADVEEMARKAKEQNIVYDSAESCGDKSANIVGQHLCLVCLRSRREVLFKPCHHICSCASCFTQLSPPWKCLVCRAQVDDIAIVYLP